MLAYFDLSKDNKARLDELIDNNRYEDYGDAINAAIEHLYLIDQQIKNSQGLVVVDDSVEPHSDIVPDAVVHRSHVQQQAGTSIPDTFKMGDLRDGPNPEMMTRPDEIEKSELSYSPDEWIFGQYNRFLPLKASCRALARLSLQGDTPLNVEQVAESISSVATALGDFLSRVDEERDLRRSERLATAFPKHGKGEEKSRKRYADQFVAEVSQSGDYRGMPSAYHLIVPEDNDHFWLSESGWKFAIFANPILDHGYGGQLPGRMSRSSQGEGDTDPLPSRLSKKERQWLLNHIADNVPRDKYAYQMIVEAIRNGSNTPGAIDTYLANKVPGVDQISGSYLTSQRSGAISRMADLDLVRRVRMGNRVKYELTQVGVQFHDSM